MCTIRTVVFLIACGLVLAVPAVATTRKSPVITSGVVVVDGAVVFCQPDKTFTVLDLATGAVLVRDPAAACDGELRLSEHGLLLSTHWGRRRMIDLAASLARKQLVPKWEIGREGCNSRIIGDVAICARKDFAVEARSLVDGGLLWSYEAPGLVNDILEGQGRLLLQSGDYRLARSVSVLDFRTGRQLFQEAIVQDASFSVRSFDGRQVVLEARPTAARGCRERILRTLSPDLSGTRLVAADTCGAAAPDWSPEPGPDLTKGWKGEQATLRLTDEGSGIWIEAQGPEGPWVSLIQPQNMVRLASIVEGPGVLLLERFNFEVAMLECLDVTSGRPRWLYVHGPARHRKAKWDEVKAAPPSGTVPVGVTRRPAEDRAQEIERRLSRAPYPAPRRLDPLPADQTRQEDRPLPVP